MAEYIDKGDALEALYKLHVDGKGGIFDKSYTYDAYTEALYGAVRSIEDIDSADVAPVRHGKWIEDSDGMVVCDQCGATDEINTTTGEFVFNNYCANCGAKMDGE